MRDSLHDIEVTSDRSIIDRAFELKNDDKAAEAIGVFKLAAEQSQHEGVACMMIAGLYYSELDDPENALPFAQRAVRLRPKNEFASICFMHCLVDQGRQDEAQAEIRRYISIGSELDLYNTLLEENGLEAADFM